MKNWLYDGEEIKSVDNFPENCHGFVYLIENKKNNHFYVGKKILFNNIKRKIGKKETKLIIGKGRRPLHERLKKESNWKTYNGSSSLLNQEIKDFGINNFSRTILDLAYSKKHLSFLEMKYHFQFDVLNNEFALNENIAGKFFKRDLIFE